MNLVVVCENGDAARDMKKAVRHISILVALPFTLLACTTAPEPVDVEDADEAAFAPALVCAASPPCVTAVMGALALTYAAAVTALNGSYPAANDAAWDYIESKPAMIPPNDPCRQYLKQITATCGSVTVPRNCANLNLDNIETCLMSHHLANRAGCPFSSCRTTRSKALEMIVKCPNQGFQTQLNRLDC